MLKHLFAAALLLVGVPTVASAATTVTTDSSTYSGLGSTIGGIPDVVGLSSQTFNLTGPGIYNLFAVTFTAGFTGSDSVGNTGLLPASGDFGGTSVPFDIAYALTIGPVTDNILLGGNSFTYGAYNFLINPLQLSSSGEGATGVLTATVSAVPEPATWLSLLFGFGMIGFALQRRQRMAHALA